MEISTEELREILSMVLESREEIEDARDQFESRIYASLKEIEKELKKDAEKENDLPF